MDQKNTIVKCKAHPDCLFNHNGVCDNYVINIGTDGKCEGYVETATEVCKLLIYYTDKKPIKVKQPNAKIKTIMPVCDWSCKYAIRDGNLNPYIWCQLRQLNPVQGFTCNLYEEE